MKRLKKAMIPGKAWLCFLASGFLASAIMVSCGDLDTDTTNSENEKKAPVVDTTTPVAYTITYDKNGATDGLIPMDNTKYKKGDTVSVKSNSGNLMKTDYSFAGWNTLSNGTGTTYTGGDTFQMGDSNTTLFAKWNAKLAAPANLETYAWFGYSLIFDWEPVTGAVSYNVYGSSGTSMSLLANTTDKVYIDHSSYIASPGTFRSYYVTAVDKSGVEGARSSIITESTLSPSDLATNTDKANAKQFTAGTYCFNDYFFSGQDHLWFKQGIFGGTPRTLTFSSLYGMKLVVNVYKESTLLNTFPIDKDNAKVAFTATGGSGFSASYYYELIWDKTGYETGEFVVN